MQDRDSQRFAEIMAALSEVYEMNVSGVLIEIWFKALEEFDIDTVSTAAYDYMKNPDSGRYKPKPADLIKIIKGTTKDRAYIAWTKVDKAIRSIGDYESVVFDDPVIHKVITDMGGWIGFGDTPEKEWGFKANDFMNRYRGCADRIDREKVPPKLTGIHEVNNLRDGYEIEPPAMIGDSKKALELLTSSKPNQLT
jgi:hypothetical protein